MFEGLSIYDFQAQFGDDRLCTDALVQLKWSDGYKCRYCGYGNYCQTKRYGERRCCSCKKPESATAKIASLEFIIYPTFKSIPISVCFTVVSGNFNCEFATPKEVPKMNPFLSKFDIFCPAKFFVKKAMLIRIAIVVNLICNCLGE